MRDTGPDADQEARARRQAQLEQRHLEAYRNMHRLRDALHRRLAALLTDKVQSQRSQLQQRHDTTRAKSERDTKLKQKKLVFSRLQHDDSYLTSLPKTSYYLIFDLQNQLAERGHLKTHHDLEDFYRGIKYNGRPSQLQRSLQDVRNKMLGNRSAADLTSENHPCAVEDGGREDDNSHSRLIEEGSGSEEIPAELIYDGVQESNETDQMFPKIKVPTFATLQPNFTKKLQRKMPDLIIPEIPERSRRAEIYLGRLKQMHELCLINMAFSQRLLDKDSDWLCWQEEHSVQDLVLPHIDSKQEKRRQTIQPPLSSPKQPTNVQNEPPLCPQRLSRTSSVSQQQPETLVWATTACCRQTPDPLSMEDVCQQKRVAIVDRECKLWRNYT
ncbi:uncharacterized protein si:ch211-130h14.4 [Anabas testudineus]|uniref:uncharacterized protein si:ch211-130h14.4 n=1 Tax=Anabas testudineus TaxID=64144 RepID=UPI000E45426A|nr:uncharacterized protein si:ch211-130h14.4 [Anabas testudineus]